MPYPKKDAKTWSLNLREVPIALYWYFHEAAQKKREEFGEWVLGVLKKAAEEELHREPPKEKRAKTSPASRASSDRED